MRRTSAKSAALISVRGARSLTAAELTSVSTPPNSRRSRIDQTLDVGLDPDISRHRQRLAAGACNGVDDLGQRLGAPTEDGHERSFRREEFRNGAADAGSGPCDDGDLAIKRAHCSSRGAGSSRTSSSSCRRHTGERVPYTTWRRSP